MSTHVLTSMPLSGVRSAIGRAIDVLGRFPLPLLQLLSRLALASVFLKAGFNKLASWELTIQLFADEYKVPLLPPETAAAMATTFEIGCSMLLIFGLGTRLAVLPLLGMIAVIQTFVYPSAYSEHLTWASLLLFLLTRGGGRWSLDYLLGLEPSTTP
jgi:putative oxidoreductase